MISNLQIPVVEKRTEMTTTFLGYNRQEIIRDGEMYDTKNLSGDIYPSLGLRKKRGITSYDTVGQDPVPLTGINGRDQLTFVRGTEVFYNLNKVQGLTVSAAAADNPKKIVNFGAYVCIWPDKKYFNTVQLSDYGSMERLFTIAGQNVSLTMCRGDGTNYDMAAITVSATAPTSPTNGKLWIDQSGDNDVLRQYSSATDEWVEVPSVYVKISATGIGHGLKEYDAIDISGLEAVSTASARIKSMVSALNGSMIVYFAGEDYVVIAGIISETQAALKTDTTVKADLSIPDLDWITESNNRLWGCRYGLKGTEVVNEIRCSKLGDFRNWNCFMGLSTDSYVASVGTDGPFTAAVTQKGYPVFLKENVIHQVYGTTPSSFQVQAVVCRGCQDGSGNSAVVVNEQVYYKSRTGVMMFDGSMPVDVSEQLGDVLYSNARAGALKGKYYICMKDKTNHWALFTYDTEQKVWYREDDFHALGFGRVNDELYAIDEDNNTLVAMTGSMGTLEEDFPWAAEFGISGMKYTPTSNGYSREDTAGKRYISRFDIRAYMEEDTQAQLKIMYDSSGEWESVGQFSGSRMGTKLIPVLPKRCDHLRVRIEGTGEIRIYSIARLLEVGADG